MFAEIEILASYFSSLRYNIHILENKYTAVLYCFAFWFALNDFSPELNAAASVYFSVT